METANKALKSFISQRQTWRFMKKLDLWQGRRGMEEVQVADAWQVPEILFFVAVQASGAVPQAQKRLE